MKAGINHFYSGILFLILLFHGFSVSFGQVTAGKITYERRTNLQKRFSDERMKQFVNEKNKIKTDRFELRFNDSISLFTPIESETADEHDWMTTKNTYFINSAQNSKLSVLSFIGQQVYIQDSLEKRPWKITESTRNIAGYECRKAIYQKNDSTRIYAWFCVDLVPSVGPEGFSGLPGAILGLATEDGGIVYFATNVELVAPTKEQLSFSTGKNKIYTMEEFRQKIEKDYGNTPWGKNLFTEIFRWN